VSDDTILETGSDPYVAAAELALGVLEGEERATALRRVLAEPGFAQEVERWRTHLAHLFDLWPVATPGGAVWARIERSIDALDRPAAAGRPSRYWPAAAAVTSALAAALLLVIVLRPTPAPVRVRVPVPVAIRVPVPAPTPGPTPVAPQRAQATLAATIKPANAAPVTARYDPVSGMLRVSRTALADTRRRSAQLWVIGADSTPQSLGLLQVGTATTLEISADARTELVAGVTLAISLEARGGSSTGLPQGPIVGTGVISRS
jgi:anti-sigma-K factor RskA